MKVTVTVYTKTKLVLEVEADTLDEALDEAKLEALTGGDYISQETEYEILEAGPEKRLFFAPPPAPKVRKSSVRPFQQL